jgi:hypothetical protein
MKKARQVIRQPLPFREAFWLFLRNSRRTFEPDFADRAGIGEGAATVCILAGFFAAVPVMVGCAGILIPWLVDFFWPLFIVVVAACFLLAQGCVTYAAYRIWWRWRAKRA